MKMVVTNSWGLRNATTPLLQLRRYANNRVQISQSAKKEIISVEFLLFDSQQQREAESNAAVLNFKVRWAFPGDVGGEIIVSINWKQYRLCRYPLHIWIMVDYATLLVFRLLMMFVDNNEPAAGMALDPGQQRRNTRSCGHIVVLLILSLLLYPILWTWNVIGTLWFSSARSCLTKEGLTWGFLICLLFSYYGLFSIACTSLGKWLSRRRFHVLRAHPGDSISEYGVLVDIIRVPSWAFEAAARQELRRMVQDTVAYHPRLYLSTTQREAMETLIQELPKFRLNTVPVDCSECPICLEEFCEGNEVRGLPCAHSFHVECIDQWLRLNVNCPRCRCSVFPNLDLNALKNLGAESVGTSAIVLTETNHVRSQPAGQSHPLGLQGLQTDNAVVGNDADIDLEAVENGGLGTVIIQGSSSTVTSVPASEMSSIVINQSHTSHL